MKIKLSSEAKNKLLKPVEGNGGYQFFLKKLQRQFENGILELLENDLEKLKRYSEDYGNGGYQGQFKAILDCID